MAKKRRKAAAVQTTSRRRSNRKVTTSKRRKRGLSEGKNIPIIGQLSLKNPLIGGAVGGWAASLIKDEIKDTFFGVPKTTDENDLMNKIQPYTKGLVIAAAAYAANRMGYKEVAAGLVGAAAAFTREKLQAAGKLRIADNGSGSGKRLIAQYAETSMLSSPAMLSNRNMLSSGRGRRR